MAHVSCSRYTEVIDLSGTKTIRNASFTIQPHERLVVDVNLSANLETQLRSPCSISPTFSIADILAPPFDVHRATRTDECLSPKSPDEPKTLLTSGTATPADSDLQFPLRCDFEQQTFSSENHELQNTGQKEFDRSVEREQPDDVRVDGSDCFTKPDPMLSDNEGLQLQSGSSVFSGTLETTEFPGRCFDNKDKLDKTCCLTRSEIFRVDIPQDDDAKMTTKTEDVCPTPKVSSVPSSPSSSPSYEVKPSSAKHTETVTTETGDEDAQPSSPYLADTLDNLIDAARCVYAEAQLEEAESVLDQLLSKFADPSDLCTAWDNLPNNVGNLQDTITQSPSCFSPVFKVLLTQPESHIFPDLCKPSSTGRQLQDLCNQLACAIRRAKRKLRVLQKMRARQARSKKNEISNEKPNSLSTTNQTERRLTFLEKLKHIWPGSTTDCTEGEDGAMDYRYLPSSHAGSREYSKVYSNPLECPLSLLSFVTHLADPNTMARPENHLTGPEVPRRSSVTRSAQFFPESLTKIPGELAIQIESMNDLPDSTLEASWSNDRPQPPSSFESLTSPTLSIFSSSVSPSSCSTTSCGRTRRPSKLNIRRRVRGKVARSRRPNGIPPQSGAHSPPTKSNDRTHEVLETDSSKSPPGHAKRSANLCYDSLSALHLSVQTIDKPLDQIESSPAPSSSSLFGHTPRFSLPSPCETYENTKSPEELVGRKFSIQSGPISGPCLSENHTNDQPPFSSHGGTSDTHTDGSSGNLRLFPMFHDQEEMSTCSSEDRSWIRNRPPTPDVRRSDLDLSDLSDGTRVLVIQDTHLRAGTLFLHKQIPDPGIMKGGTDFPPENKRDQLFRIHLDGDRLSSATLHSISSCRPKQGGGSGQMRRCSSPTSYQSDLLSMSPSSSTVPSYSFISLNSPKKGRQSDIVLLGWQVVQQAVLEVIPSSMSHLPPGARVCASWSEQLASNLYPGTVVEASVDEIMGPRCVAVDFDDGDHRQVPIDNIRMLPDHFTNLYQLASETRGKGLSSPFLQATSPNRRSFLDPQPAGSGLKRRIRHHSDLSASTNSSGKRTRCIPPATISRNSDAHGSEPNGTIRYRITNRKASSTTFRSTSCTTTANSCATSQGPDLKIASTSNAALNARTIGDGVNIGVASSPTLSSCPSHSDLSELQRGSSSSATNDKLMRNNPLVDNDVSLDMLSSLSSPSDASPWHILEKLRRRRNGQVYCRSVERDSDGLVVSVGDTVEFSSGRDDVYLGIIRSIRWDDATDSPFVVAAWFYNPEEAGADGQRVSDIKGALFATDHVDENEARCISRHAVVLPTYAEYRQCQMSDSTVKEPQSRTTSVIHPSVPLYPDSLQVNRKFERPEKETSTAQCLEQLTDSSSQPDLLNHVNILDISSPNSSETDVSNGPLYFIAGKYDPVNRRVISWDPDVEKLIRRGEK
ncbi:hypothetical protein CSKR_105169 [Clonorchis sinensis]|uniref:BAH domain-containing protein n=1 Tax=Clonorchis sinensis TaxID=79923 RepID=A0A8T1M0I6_CLOSI|nr:hypothetical protein CSKR_105169 [Clonorchis sinensis]